MARMPALFIGHGSPMNTLKHNVYTDAWRRIGQILPRPRGILCISAHWFIGATTVTAMPHPRTIHDFHGFPDELFAFDYPAPGLPELAQEVAEVAEPHWVGADIDQWGLDHGTWSVLAHLFPDADIPVVQLSIDAPKPMEYHIDLGARLAPLRDAGILILSSGNVVHNLRRIQWNKPEAGEPWAERFDDHVAGLMAEAPGDLLKAMTHPDYAQAVPTPDHFIPLLYIAGLGAVSNEKVAPLIRGHALGSLSMTCYGFGMDACLSPYGLASNWILGH
ncbi:4,5-DOPA dioxygenase extradiol [Sphingobium sp. EM0848]|uniref:4,5-DOPA-extradiol-dioxygenase n=1 Tax=Sphingobium sp. EM0848 TaxID=2743473 RepID=UPI002100B536|nr:4,5-DOPA dioxygenase extradiol [Sphingobium sp. EM0848]